MRNARSEGAVRVLVLRKDLARFLNESGWLPDSEFPAHSSLHVSLLRIKALTDSDTGTTQSPLSSFF